MIGREHAAALPRGHALARRCRPDAHRDGRRGHARRRRHGAQRRLHAPLRHRRRPARPRPAAAAPIEGARRRSRRRCRCATTCSSTRRRRCGSRTTRRASRRPPTCSCAAPSTGRCSSAAPRSSAARSPSRARRYVDHARHDRLQQPDAHRAVLRHRDGDARARARRDLPRSRCARPARSTGSRRSSRPIRRCRRSRCWRCCSATSRRARTSSSGSSAPTSRRRSSCCASAPRARSPARVSSEVGRVVEQTFGVDTFQLTPSLVDPNAQSSRLDPAARLTIGKRLSDRIYLTYSRSLSSSTRDQIILLEYDQTDRFSWILSRNEDRHLRARRPRQTRRSDDALSLQGA